MNTTKESVAAYEIALSGPGMQDNVRLDVRISCKNALLLAMVIEQVTTGADGPGSMKKILSEEDLKALTLIRDGILDRAKLGDLYNKLRDYLK